MKFEINKNVLAEGLNKVARVVSQKNPLPILQGILIEANKNEIILTGSDSTETIIHYIPVDGQNVDVIETGKTVFPRHVIDIVKKSTKNLTFTLNDFISTIKFGRSQFQLNCMDAEEYPKFPQLEMDKPSVTLDGKQFSDFVKRTAFAAADDAKRPILQGIQYHVEDNCMSFVSTDAHRLAQVKMNVSETENNQLIFPAKALLNAVRIFDVNQEVNVYSDNSSLIYLRNGQTVYSTRLLDGNYPETSRLIPNNFKTIMRIDRNEFINALELMRGIADPQDKSATAQLHINGAASLSSHQAHTGKGNIELPYESLEGEDDFTINFSMNYALDSLKAIESDLVEFKFESPMRPFLVLPTEQGGFEELQLILPVRTY